MRRNLLWAVIVVATALVQTTWLDAIRLQGVLPDLTLLLVVYFAIADGEERAMFTGVLGGLYQDVAGNAVLGHHIVCHVIVGYVAGRVAQRLIHVGDQRHLRHHHRRGHAGRRAGADRFRRDPRACGRDTGID